MNLPPNNDDAGTIAADVAARLIMVEPGAFDQLVREGWFKPVARLRYKLVDVVQGHIKSMQHEIERGRTAAESAAHIDIGVGRFMQLVETDVIPRQKSRSYRLDDVRQVYIRHLRAVAAGQGADGGVTLAGERALLAREQREAAMLKNAIARGEYVSLGAVQRAVEDHYSVVRERTLSAPGKCADRLTSHCAEDRGQIMEILMEEARDALGDLSTDAFMDAKLAKARGQTKVEVGDELVP